MDDTLVLWDEIIKHRSDFIETSAWIIPEIDDNLPIPNIFGDNSESLYKCVLDPDSEGGDFDMMISVIEALIFYIINSNLRSGNREIELLSPSADMEFNTGSLNSLDFIDCFLECSIFIDGEIIDFEDHISTLETSSFCWSPGDRGDDMELSWFGHIDIGTDSFEFTTQLILEILGFCRWEIRGMFIFARICHTFGSTLYEFLIFEFFTIIVGILEFEIDIIEDGEI